MTGLEIRDVIIMSTPSVTIETLDLGWYNEYTIDALAFNRVNVNNPARTTFKMRFINSDPPTTVEQTHPILNVPDQELQELSPQGNIPADDLDVLNLDLKRFTTGPTPNTYERQLPVGGWYRSDSIAELAAWWWQWCEFVSTRYSHGYCTTY